ncbi:MFS transporter [Corynebacterium efficiens]|uniref:Putative transport protein n=1 Tax=Corynebacterium efficiens (strain DSM 44549 / YS-314 / AJ 12310 / JCM 11189 / NBRC 100395) TaxID=196164 RepID=Q8FRS1_COREF|nr:MFS transporter [Corynebacterium efficiens]BAC17498.1 putative transport protein [Corynebacterium efficiens YS-314]
MHDSGNSPVTVVAHTEPAGGGTGPRLQRRRVPRQTEISSTRRYIVMTALALGGFGIGVTEFVSMGLLSMIAQDFPITEDQAGLIITLYALGVVIGAPLITAFTGRIPRRRLLLILMAAFVVGNALSIFDSSYTMLLVARFLAGLPHGAYFSVAGLSAASMAPEGQRGRAVAFVGMGLSVATVIGVPAAQLLGTSLGWHAAYGLVTAIGVVTLVSLWFLMPHMSRMAATSPLTELGALKKGQVWLTLAIGSVGFGGMFAVYTYISWTMTEQAGMPDSLIWVVLMAYGVGMVIGNYVGGRLADWNVDRGILLALICIVVVLIGFYFTSHHPVAGTINFGLVGFFGSTLVPSLQVRLMDVAGRAQTLAASLNHSALNIGNAVGASMGGAVIAAGYSYSAPALAGALLATAAIGIWFPMVWLRRRT